MLFEALIEPLGSLRHLQGVFQGRMEGLGLATRSQLLLDSLTDDVHKSSEIEGEHLNRDSIRSSIARRLGIELEGSVRANHYVDGLVEITIDASQNYATPLTSERLFSWHAALFPTGRNAYYDALGGIGKGDLDITAWILWFMGCLDRTIASSQHVSDKVLSATRFWDSVADIEFNERQRKVLMKLFSGLEGKLTAEKWAKFTGASRPTALRDITDLIEKGILRAGEAGGRSTSYVLRDG